MRDNTLCVLRAITDSLERNLVLNKVNGKSVFLLSIESMENSYLIGGAKMASSQSDSTSGGHPLGNKLLFHTSN